MSNTKVQVGSPSNSISNYAGFIESRALSKDKEILEFLKNMAMPIDEFYPSKYLLSAAAKLAGEERWKAVEFLIANGACLNFIVYGLAKAGKLEKAMQWHKRYGTEITDLVQGIAMSNVVSSEKFLGNLFEKMLKENANSNDASLIKANLIENILFGAGIAGRAEVGEKFYIQYKDNAPDCLKLFLKGLAAGNCVPDAMALYRKYKSEDKDSSNYSISLLSEIMEGVGIANYPFEISSWETLIKKHEEALESYAFGLGLGGHLVEIKALQVKFGNRVMLPILRGLCQAGHARGLQVLLRICSDMITPEVINEIHYFSACGNQKQIILKLDEIIPGSNPKFQSPLTLSNLAKGAKDGNHLNSKELLLHYFSFPIIKDTDALFKAVLPELSEALQIEAEKIYKLAAYINYGLDFEQLLDILESNKKLKDLPVLECDRVEALNAYITNVTTLSQHAKWITIAAHGHAPRRAVLTGDLISEKSKAAIRQSFESVGLKVEFVPKQKQGLQGYQVVVLNIDNLEVRPSIIFN